MDKYAIPEGSLISFMSDKVKKHGGINLAQGIPSFDPPAELLKKLQNISTEKIHQYAPGTGDMELVNQIQEKYTGVSANEIQITNGGTEAISLIFTYLNQKIKNKYSVFAFEPVYESYINLPRIFNVNFCSLPLTNEAIDFDLLEETIIQNNVSVFFLASPGNPYGRMLSKTEIEKLIDLSVSAQFYLIIDAVYKELYFNEPPYIPYNNLPANVFYTNSFSKTLSITGWRIGYFICHEEHMKAIRSIHDYIGLSSPSVLQKAIARYLRDFNWGENYINQLRSTLENNYITLNKFLIDHGFVVPPVDGGYFIWAKLPEKFDNGFNFAIDLYEQQKVAVIPGIHFAASATNFIRINIAQNEAEIQEAMSRIHNFIN